MDIDGSEPNPMVGDPVQDVWPITCLTRYLWVKRMYIPAAELESAFASDLDALADERFGSGCRRRGSVSYDRVRFPPPNAPDPPTTVRADLYLGWAYYEKG